MTGVEQFECGTMSMYRKGCKCGPCKEANAKNSYRKRLAAGWKPSRRHVKWKGDNLKLLGTMSDGEVGKLVGTHTKNVQAARARRGIPAFKPVVTTTKGINWDEQTHLLGKCSDTELAIRFGVSVACVQQARVRRGIPAYPRTSKHRLKDFMHLLGKLQDTEIAALVGVSRDTVLYTRMQYGIKRAKRSNKHRAKVAALIAEGKLQLPKEPVWQPSIQNT